MWNHGAAKVDVPVAFHLELRPAGGPIPARHRPELRLNFTAALSRQSGFGNLVSSSHSHRRYRTPRTRVLNNRSGHLFPNIRFNAGPERRHAG